MHNIFMLGGCWCPCSVLHGPRICCTVRVLFYGLQPDHVPMGKLRFAMVDGEGYVVDGDGKAVSKVGR